MVVKQYMEFFKLDFDSDAFKECKKEVNRLLKGRRIVNVHSIQNDNKVFIMVVFEEDVEPAEE